MEGFSETTLRYRGSLVRALLGGPPDGSPLLLLHGLGGAAVNWGLLAPELAREVGVAAVTGARPLSKNAYKVPLTRAVVERTVLTLAG